MCQIRKISPLFGGTLCHDQSFSLRLRHDFLIVNTLFEKVNSFTCVALQEVTSQCSLGCQELLTKDELHKKFVEQMDMEIRENETVQSIEEEETPTPLVAEKVSSVTFIFLELFSIYLSKVDMLE